MRQRVGGIEHAPARPVEYGRPEALHPFRRAGTLALIIAVEAVADLHGQVVKARHAHTRSTGRLIYHELDAHVLGVTRSGRDVGDLAQRPALIFGRDLHGGIHHPQALIRSIKEVHPQERARPRDPRPPLAGRLAHINGTPEIIAFRCEELLVSRPPVGPCLAAGVGPQAVHAGIGRLRIHHAAGAAARRRRLPVATRRERAEAVTFKAAVVGRRTGDRVPGIGAPNEDVSPRRYTRVGVDAQRSRGCDGGDLHRDFSRIPRDRSVRRKPECIVKADAAVHWIRGIGRIQTDRPQVAVARRRVSRNGDVEVDRAPPLGDDRRAADNRRCVLIRRLVRILERQLHHQRGGGHVLPLHRDVDRLALPHRRREVRILGHQARRKVDVGVLRRLQVRAAEERIPLVQPTQRGPFVFPHQRIIVRHGCPVRRHRCVGLDELAVHGPRFKRVELVRHAEVVPPHAAVGVRADESDARARPIGAGQRHVHELRHAVDVNVADRRRITIANRHGNVMPLIGRQPGRSDVKHDRARDDVRDAAVGIRNHAGEIRRRLEVDRVLARPPDALRIHVQRVAAIDHAAARRAVGEEDVILNRDVGVSHAEPVLHQHRVAAARSGGAGEFAVSCHGPLVVAHRILRPAIEVAVVKIVLGEYVALVLQAPRQVHVLAAGVVGKPETPRATGVGRVHGADDLQALARNADAEAVIGRGIEARMIAPRIARIPRVDVDRPVQIVACHDAARRQREDQIREACAVERPADDRADGDVIVRIAGRIRVLEVEPHFVGLTAGPLKHALGDLPELVRQLPLRIHIEVEEEYLRRRVRVRAVEMADQRGRIPGAGHGRQRRRVRDGRPRVGRPGRRDLAACRVIEIHVVIVRAGRNALQSADAAEGRRSTKDGRQAAGFVVALRILHRGAAVGRDDVVGALVDPRHDVRCFHVIHHVHAWENERAEECLEITPVEIHRTADRGRPARRVVAVFVVVDKVVAFLRLPDAELHGPRADRRAAGGEREVGRRQPEIAHVLAVEIHVIVRSFDFDAEVVPGVLHGPVGLREAVDPALLDVVRAGTNHELQPPEGVEVLDQDFHEVVAILVADIEFRVVEVRALVVVTNIGLHRVVGPREARHRVDVVVVADAPCANRAIPEIPVARTGRTDPVGGE